MNRLLIVLLAGLCMGVNHAHAQDSLHGVMEASSPRATPLPFDSLRLVHEPQPLPNWYDFAVNLPRDVGSFARVSVETKFIPTMAGLAVLTFGVFSADHRISLFSRASYRRSQTVASLSDFFVSVGDGRSPLLLAGTFGAYGFLTSDHRALRVASQTLEALLATGVAVQTFKHIAGRESPAVSTSARGTWRPFPSFQNYNKHQARYYSFPSGHIATTMAAVTVLAENYPEAPWLKPAGYSVTGLVGISLVNKGWHWYSDLPLGIAIGYAFGTIVSHPDGDMEPADQGDIKLSFSPVADERGNGLLVAMQF